MECDEQGQQGVISLARQVLLHGTMKEMRGFGEIAEFLKCGIVIQDHAGLYPLPDESRGAGKSKAGSKVIKIPDLTEKLSGLVIARSRDVKGAVWLPGEPAVAIGVPIEVQAVIIAHRQEEFGTFKVIIAFFGV